MKLKGLVFFIAFLFAATGFAKNIEFEEFKLDNGLHVIMHKDNSTPIVAVTVTYHVGSKDEDPERTGFAHFFEHLMFEGSKNIERGQFDKLVLGNGGTLNASTSFDKTYYYEILPSNQLELGLWLEAERMLHLKIDSTGVETQRSVVKEERKQRLENQPYGSILEQIFSHAYRVHPYRWIPIGSVQYIDQATIEEFIEFHGKFYVPKNATLSIAGDIDYDQTKEWVEKYFGGIPSGEKIDRNYPAEPALGKVVKDTVYDNIQLPAVIHSYHMPAQGTKDYYALDMLTTLLSAGKSSRIYKEVVDNKQLAVQAVSVPFALEDPGLFIFFGLANMGISPDTLSAAFDAEIVKVQNEMISEKEFQKLRNQIENNFIQSNSTVTGIAGSLANYHVYFGDANLINDEIDRYMEVTREDIKRVANKYLTMDSRVILYYLPKSAQK